MKLKLKKEKKTKGEKSIRDKRVQKPLEAAQPRNTWNRVPLATKISQINQARRRRCAKEKRKKRKNKDA